MTTLCRWSLSSWHPLTICQFDDHPSAQEAPSVIPCKSPWSSPKSCTHLYSIDSSSGGSSKLKTCDARVGTSSCQHQCNQNQAFTSYYSRIPESYHKISPSSTTVQAGRRRHRHRQNSNISTFQNVPHPATDATALYWPPTEKYITRLKINAWDCGHLQPSVQSHYYSTQKQPQKKHVWTIQTIFQE